MTDNPTPRVLLRYETERTRDEFARYLAADFEILPCHSDEQALAALDQPDHGITALVLLEAPFADPTHSELLMQARDQHPDLLKILVCESIGLNVLATLLETGLVDRCFEHPVNPDLVRSHILTASLLQRDPLPAPGGMVDDGTNKPTVLIVDDEQTATKYLSRQLNRMQEAFTVLCASDAEEALTIVNDPAWHIAVVMTDQRMPGLQGKELLDELKQSRPDIVRILTSAYGEVDVALDAVNEGRIFRYQTKPWQAIRLLPIFREALARHHSLAKARQARDSEITEQFRQIAERRRQLLLETLSPLIDNLAGGPVTGNFLASLATIETLPPNASHIRASSETPLERQLVDQFTDRLSQQTARLSSAKETGRAGGRASLEELWEGMDSQADDATPKTAARASELLLGALATLLAASGQPAHSLRIEASDHGAQLMITPARPIKFYTHLLAPLTRLSAPLLEQQVALLMLHLTTRKLGGTLDTEGGRQSCKLRIQLPADADTGTQS